LLLWLFSTLETASRLFTEEGLEYLASFIVFALVTTVTPGPNNIMILSSGINFGCKESFPLICGVVFGFPLMILIVGLGLGEVMIQWDWFHHALDIIGISYLLILAWKIATAPLPSVDVNRKPMGYGGAFAIQWVNIKAWIMIVGAIGAYTTPSNFYIELAIIVGCFFVVSVFNASAWLFLNILRSLRH
jgi:threonine/homoserine/homoserine lactone efflux protein